MVTYYTLIAEDRDLSLRSHFYSVMVGSMPSAQKALFRLNAYCRQHNYYFAKRSREDDIFRLRIAESLGVKVYELPSMLIKVEALLSSLDKHGQLPFDPTSSGNYRFLKEQTQPDFFLFSRYSCLKRPTL